MKRVQNPAVEQTTDSSTQKDKDTDRNTEGDRNRDGDRDRDMAHWTLMTAQE